MTAAIAEVRNTLNSILQIDKEEWREVIYKEMAYLPSGYVDKPYIHLLCDDEVTIGVRIDNFLYLVDFDLETGEVLEVMAE